MTSSEATLEPAAIGSKPLVCAPAVGQLGVLFFLSGASSLILETLFTRLLTYTFGNTAYATSTVLAAFLGGLALGAYVIGRWIDRARPSILIYGSLELAIGCYAALVPFLFAELTRTYVWLHKTLSLSPAGTTAVRFLLASVVIIIPSTLMGGTLPVLARIIAATRKDYHSKIDWLYAINTFGAGAGVLLCTYVLMPAFGVRGAIASACLMNAAIFLYTFWSADFAPRNTASRTESEIFEEESGRAELSSSAPGRGGEVASPMGVPGARNLVLIAALLTGLITLSYEVIWTHALAFLVGNAVYSFGTMLFTFLCGLALGAHVVSRVPRNSVAWVWTFALSQLAAGLMVLLTLPLWNRVPELFVRGVKGTLRFDLVGIGLLVFLRLAYVSVRNLRKAKTQVSSKPAWIETIVELLLLVVLGLIWASSPVNPSGGTQGIWQYPGAYFASTEAFRFLICFYLLIAPAFLLGVAFPTLLNLFSEVREQTGKSVGIIYAANTLGCISGSLLTGFFLLEFFGSYATLWLAAVFNIGLGLVFLVLLAPAKRAWKLAAVGASGLVLVLFSVRPSTWSISELTRGTYVYFDRPWAFEKVVYAREDVQGGLTTVVQAGPAAHELLTNGKFQGSNGAEIPEQIRFALVPALFTHQFDRALVIGLGTGNSLRSLSAFPFRQIDVAEFAPALIDAARKWFGDVNGGVIDADPRVHMIVADGRNHLLLSQDRYNLITIEVSSIWISGEGDIYNKEFYQLCRSHLTEDGVLQQWVQLHHLRPQDFQVILSTAAQVFPQVNFFLGPTQGFLIASSRPLSIDYRQIESFDHTPAVRGELERIHRHSLLSLIGELSLDDQHSRSFVGALSQWTHIPPNFASTDLFPYLEYQTPKGNVLPKTFLLNPNSITQFGAGSPVALELRDMEEPTDVDYVNGLALEDTGDLQGAINVFLQVRGRNAVCAQQEVYWIQGIQRRMRDPREPIPASPSPDCP